MKKCLLLIALLLPFLLPAQKKQGKARLDSLIAALPNLSDGDTNKVKTLIDIGNIAYTINPDIGLKFGAKALTLAEEMAWPMGIARANMVLGLNNDARSYLSVSLDHYFVALKEYEKMNYKRGIALSCWGIANVFNMQKAYDKSLEYDFKALKISREIKDKATEGGLLGNIANNYLFKGDLDKALEYYQKGLPIMEQQNDSLGIGIQLQNIGSVHFKKSEYASALTHYFLARQYLKREYNKSAYARGLSNLGACYLKIALDSPYVVIKDSRIPAGKVENVDLAISYLKEAIELGSDIGDMSALQDAYGNLSEALENKGDYKGALEAHKHGMQLKDSVFSQESSIKIAQLANQRDLEMKDKDIKIEHLKSTIFITGTVLLLVIVLIIIFQFRKQVRSNKQLASEKEKHLEHIQAQGDTLKDIAYIQSHHVRGPVTTILGLSQLFNVEHPEDPQNKELLAGITSAAVKLDRTVTDVINKENNIKKR